MKGRHVVILVFVFGLSLIAILFRLLPSAKPPPPPLAAPAAPTPAPPPPKPVEPYTPQDPLTSGSIEVMVRSKGEPVRGAIVSFQSGARTFQLTTGADGKCPVTKVEPGEWRIIARGPADLAPDTETAQVATGRAVTVDLDLAAGVRVEGFVRDGAGNPVGGAKIQLELQDPGYTTRSDTSGRYSLNNIPTGKHTLTASSERLRPQTHQLDLSTPGQTLTQDFTLTQGAGVGGRVVDDTGAPVARAMITVSNEVARVVRSDEQGNFRAEGLGEGPVTIMVNARGFAPASEQKVTPGRTDVVVKLMRGAVLQGKLDGTPVAFTVHLSRFDEAASKSELVRSEAFTVQSEGVFYVRDLAPGRYEVVVETATHKTPAPVPAHLQAAETVDIGLVLLAPKQ